MEHPSVVAGNFQLQVFHSTFWAFLYISKAPLGRSLWSGHHWKGSFLLQKLRNVDDANFGQKRWHQKRKKGQGSSRAVTGGGGVNGLKQQQMSSWSTYIKGREFRGKSALNLVPRVSIYRIFLPPGETVGTRLKRPTPSPFTTKAKKYQITLAAIKLHQGKAKS